MKSEKIEKLEKEYEKISEEYNQMTGFIKMLAGMSGEKLFKIEYQKREILNKITKITVGDEGKLTTEKLTEEQKEKVINVLDQIIKILDDLDKEFKGE